MLKDVENLTLNTNVSNVWEENKETNIFQTQ
jgi:hypothetical protein